jgi:hypothetical protein
MNKTNYLLAIMPLALSLNVQENSTHLNTVSDDLVTQQRAALAHKTKNNGFGPKSPRNIAAVVGTNTIDFGAAPAYDHELMQHSFSKKC